MTDPTSTVTRLPAGAVLRPLVLPAQVDAGPTPLIRAYAETRNTVIRENTDSEDETRTPEELLPGLYSDRDRDRRQWYVELEGAVVGCTALDILRDGGGEAALVNLALPEAVWGRGIGTAVYAVVEQVARDAGVRRLLHWSEHHDQTGELSMLAAPTGSGSVPLDRAARFLTHHGFGLEQVERASALVWSDAAVARLQTLRAEASQHAGDYRIVQWSIPTPPEHLDGYAWMKSRMSTDAPDGDLGTPEEAWDGDRVRRQDDMLRQRGWSMLVTAAQHVETGELCAYNELAMGPDPTKATHQLDTLVLADHRGHRLGMLVKTEGLLAWREEHPQSPRVRTYNAEENRPMLSINETIGFAPIAYEGAWKKELQ